MKKSYKILYQAGEGEIVEKKSRFIATIRPVESEEEALSFIAEMRKKYWDASHNVYAYIVEENGVMRYSDDGEPSANARANEQSWLAVRDFLHNAVAARRAQSKELQ